MDTRGLQKDRLKILTIFQKHCLPLLLISSLVTLFAGCAIPENRELPITVAREQESSRASATCVLKGRVQDSTGSVPGAVVRIQATRTAVITLLISFLSLRSSLVLPDALRGG